MDDSLAERGSRRCGPVGTTLLFIAGVALLWATVLTAGPDSSTRLHGDPPAPVPSPQQHLAAHAFGIYRPFAFTVPDRWEVLWPAGMTEPPSLPGSHGLLVRSTVTGDGFVFAYDPWAVDETGRDQRLLARSPLALAQWVAHRPSVEASAITRTTVGGRPAWQVDLRHRAGAHLVGDCLAGESCSPVFGLTHPTRSRGAVLGTLPGRSSRALLFSSDEDGPSVPLLVWVWDTAGVDDVRDSSSEIRGVVDSLDFTGRVA